MTEQLIVIDNNKDLQELINSLDDHNVWAFDCETTGVKNDSKIIGVSLCAELHKAYYVILSKWDISIQSLIELETTKLIVTLCHKLISKKLIMHNAVFDCARVYNNYKISLINSLHTDTMILGHLLNENRRNGLKELGVSLFGEDSKVEQTEMKLSVQANGGVLTKQTYELYKADPYLLGKYGAKDALLTLKVLYGILPELETDDLDSFFYADESMPLLRGPTYDLNTTGLKVDVKALQDLKGTLESECHESKALIYEEITPIVKHKYPATTEKNTFNIGSKDQLSWLVHDILKNLPAVLTKGGRDLTRALDLKVPYSDASKRAWIQAVQESKGKVYEEAVINTKTKKLGRPKKVKDYWCYLSTSKHSQTRLAKKYRWVAELLKYTKNLKLLNTYVIGIQERMEYGIIRPSFLQHGTTSGRYSSKNPNFQNLPRDDKRVKKCIVSRPGKSFVGSDYSQLEPRVFASFAADERLLNSFVSGDDIYSLIGMETFDKFDCTPKKDGSPDAFGIKYKKLRDIAKGVMLAATYGTTASRMATMIDKPIEEAQYVIDSYFMKFPSVKRLMIESHDMAKKDGKVVNLFGRPRRMPEAQTISRIYGKTSHEELPYVMRNLLNLAVNHRIQSTAASIVNRAMIAFYSKMTELGIKAPIVMNIHDEIVAECDDQYAEIVKKELQNAMENTVQLPGVKLEAIPKIAKNLADLK